MKKLFGVLIAVAMMMALVVPSFADDALNIYEGESQDVDDDAVTKGTGYEADGYEDEPEDDDT